MRVLVTGAGGFLGSHVVERLRADGHDVRALVRASNVPPALAALGAEVLVGDVTDPASCAAACRDRDAVVHAAGLVTEVALPDEEYLRVNAGGSAELARAAAAARVRRLVHVGSTAVYRPNAKRPIDESTPFAPEDVYGRSKAEAERRLAEIASGTGLDVVVVRPSRIYGPRDASLVRLFRAIARGRFWMVGRGEAEVDFVHARDVAAALVAALERGQGAYLVGGPERVTIRRFVEEVAAAVGRRLPARTIPIGPAMLAARLVAALWSAAGREPPVAPKRFAFLVNGRVVDSSRAAAELGVRAQIGVRDGVADTARWYRAAGWL